MRLIELCVYFGPPVTPPFQRNVEFEDEGLQNCSIVIRGVSRRDESCYKCLFNAYPDGPISGRTCLQVNELYGSSLVITQTNNSHTALSCSATGRPVPIVTWDHIMIEHSTTVDVTHPNELSQLLQQCPVYLTKTPRSISNLQYLDQWKLSDCDSAKS
ncbi:OX-2 membrane glycoprotein-like [Salvelinus namaycush]|uniref:OX-2 membrane glycoprotein-like n=1 Tax=Salvelinus namaycush TaxID=8040 RepID=A0A8U0R1U6_SALNM|nr:OX-2 membrane glycoprotein-like [Salvelinus namaycush]